MSNVATVDQVGYLACNFCGHVTCHNARKPSLLWLLCKSCRFVNELGGDPLKGNIGRPSYSRYAKPPVINRETPDCHSRNPQEPIWWDSEEVEEPNSDYHLLTCRASENRLHPIYIQTNSPTYSTAYKLVYGVTLETDDSNDDSDFSVE